MTPIPGQRGEHQLAPDRRDTPEQVQEEPAVGSARSVPLDRLLSVAVLTPAQASLLAVQVLDGAHLDGAVGGTHGAAPSVGPVLLTSSGALDVSPPQVSASTAAQELVRALVHNARRLPAHPRPDQLALLHQLERVADEQDPAPDARARELEAALTEHLGPRRVRRLPGQLAALVDAFARVAPSVPASVDALTAPGSSRVAPRVVPSPRGAVPARRRGPVPPRGRSSRVAVFAIALAVVVGVGAYALLSEPGGGTAASAGHGRHHGEQGRHHRAGRAHQAAEQPRRHQPVVVPSLGPRQAGPITGVAIEGAGTCTPGTLCPVKVTVHFRAAPTSQSVAWRVGTVRVCKRGVTWSPPVTVTAQPGWTTVYASSTVRIPQGHSFALTALTSTPARAQSPPVTVRGSSLRC